MDTIKYIAEVVEKAVVNMTTAVIFIIMFLIILDRV